MTDQMSILSFSENLRRFRTLCLLLFSVSKTNCVHFGKTFETHFLKALPSLRKIHAFEYWRSQLTVQARYVELKQGKQLALSSDAAWIYF